MNTDKHNSASLPGRRGESGKGRKGENGSSPAQVLSHLCSVVVAVLLLLIAGCEKPAPSKEAGAGSGHAHTAPHGGKLVQLGDHEFNLELVAGPDGLLNAYILDAHAENFVRIIAPAFKITAKIAGKEETLEFKAVTSAASGETVGSTSAFQAQADWLKTTTSFDGVLQELAVKGTIYRSIAFKFP